MNQNKLSSRVYVLIKSALAAAVLPVLFIYIMIAKPDYRIMNAMAHIVLPVANWTGDVITWPVRAIGGMFSDIHELSTLRRENEELRVQLDAALRDSATCAIATLENQKLVRELDTATDSPYDVVVADVKYDNSAFHHSTFLINKGTNKGLQAGMAVMSPDERFVGTIIDVGYGFARVRAVTDSETNIAVRVAGSEVYGFLQGNGTATPKMGLFSDPEFQPTAGIKLVTSNISGILPAGIFVGDMVNDSDVDVISPRRLSRVMVLKFNAVGEYQ